MKSNERLQALKILTALLQDKTPLSQTMSSSVDVAPMTKELCFGVCRHYFRLEAIARCLVKKQPKSMEVWIILLIGLYQLHYMHAPDYAVVQETVALLNPARLLWAKGLVNAVLRQFCRQKETILAKVAADPAFCYGQPPWLLQRLQSDWPEHWQAIAQANDNHPPMTLRVNTQKCSVTDYLSDLKATGMEAHAHPVASAGITLVNPCPVQQLPGFAEGVVSVQDAAAQLAASLLDLQPGLRVLDACCAPGGKTCHMLEAEPQLAVCAALDVDAKRLLRVKDNLTRLQLAAQLIQGDALNPDSWWDKQLFDRILVDAPCSATGVIRRHSDIKLTRTPAEVSAIVNVQAQMLNALWPLLAPGGRMVYATCSVIADENAHQIAAFVKNHADCQAIPVPLTCGIASGDGRQIFPGELGMDGFFYAVLLKI